MFIAKNLGRKRGKHLVANVFHVADADNFVISRRILTVHTLVKLNQGAGL